MPDATKIFSNNRKYCTAVLNISQDTNSFSDDLIIYNCRLSLNYWSKNDKQNKSKSKVIDIIVIASCVEF